MHKNSRLGICENENDVCAGSAYKVFGFTPETEGRTEWLVEADGESIYLYQPMHEAYLGLCGNENNNHYCGVHYKIHAWKSKLSRTRWLVEKNGSTIHLMQPDHAAYLGLCENVHFDRYCTTAKYGTGAWSTREERTQWVVEKVR